ncbi:unnamed protein product [Arctogadus glacialis]
MHGLTGNIIIKLSSWSFGLTRASPRAMGAEVRAVVNQLSPIVGYLPIGEFYFLVASSWCIPGTRVYCARPPHSWGPGPLGGAGRGWSLRSSTSDPGEGSRGAERERHPQKEGPARGPGDTKEGPARGPGDTKEGPDEGAGRHEGGPGEGAGRHEGGPGEGAGRHEGGPGRGGRET